MHSQDTKTAKNTEKMNFLRFEIGRVNLHLHPKKRTIILSLNYSSIHTQAN